MQFWKVESRVIMLKCALSGETPPNDPVVTPSGRICSRRLLLSKLTENGGRDPFDPSGSRTLDESDLVSLKADDGRDAAAAVPPRLPAAGSFPSLLGQIQSEYDAVLLELYDARRALEETRRELSQALYQNDAAVRVVARLAMERDAAREKVRELSSKVAAQPAVVEEETRKRRRVEEEEEGPAPAASAEKPAVVEPDANSAEKEEVPSDRIPQADLDAMVKAWLDLSKMRKKIAKAKKAEAASGPGLEDFAKFVEADKKSLHKTNVKAGIHCLAVGGGNLIVSGGRDKQVIVYDRSEGKIRATLKGGKDEISAADILVADGSKYSAAVATGSAGGTVRLYAGPDLAARGSAALDGTSIVGVSMHPSGKYVLASAKSGKVGVFAANPSAESDGIKLIAVLGEKGEEDLEYTCGCIHPDGLIFGAGTKDGKLHMWDLRNQKLASTLVCEGDPSPVSSLSFSENGYHFASSSLSGAVRVWDLRKQKCIGMPNGMKEEDKEEKKKPVKAVAFDPLGSFVVFGGGEGGAAATVVPVKEWDKKATIGGGGDENSVVTGIVWGSDSSFLATCADCERPVRFWGAPAATKEE